GTLTVDPADGERTVEVTFVTNNGSGPIIRYVLSYTVYDATPATPDVTPLVKFNRDGTGALSGLQQVDIAGVTRLDALAVSPNGQDVYGASRLTDQITLDGGIAVSDGQAKNNLSAEVQTNGEAVRTALSPDGKFAYSVSARYGVLTVSPVDAA